MSVASVIFCEEYDTAAFADMRIKTDQGFDFFFDALLIKLDRAIERVEVGEGDSFAPGSLCGSDKSRDLGQRVQQGIVRMGMQMDE